MKICADVIDVTERQCGADPEEDVFVDICFTFIEGYKGPSFGETNLVPSHSPEDRTMPFYKENQAGSNIAKDEIEGIFSPVLQGAQEQKVENEAKHEGESDSDDGSIIATSLLQQKAALNEFQRVPCDDESLIDKQNILDAPTVETAPKHLPKTNEPSDRIIPTTISRLYSTASMKQKENVSAGDGAAARLVNAQRFTIEKRTNAVEERDNSGNTRKVPVIEASKAMKDQNTAHSLTEQEKKTQSVRTIHPRQKPITGVLLTLKRSLSRRKSELGFGDSGHPAEGHEGSQKQGQSVDNPEDFTGDGPKEFSCTKEGRDLFDEREPDADACEIEPAMDETRGLLPAECTNLTESASPDCYLPSDDCSQSPEHDVAVGVDDTCGNEQNFFDQDKMTSTQAVKKLQRNLSMKKAIDVVRKIGSTGERKNKQKTELSAENHRQTITAEDNAMIAKDESPDHPKRKGVPTRQASVKRGAEGSHLNRRLSIQSAVNAVRKIGSVAKGEMENNKEQLGNDVMDEHNAIIVEEQGELRRDEEHEDDEMRIVNEALTIPTNGADLQRKFSIQKVVHVARRIGSAGIPEASPRAAHKLSHQENRERQLRSPTQSHAKEECTEAQSTAEVGADEPEDEITKDIQPVGRNTEDIRSNEDINTTAENSTRLQRKFSIQKAVAVVKRIGSGGKRFQNEDKQTIRTGDGAYQGHLEGGLVQETRPNVMRKLFSRER